MFIFEDRAQTSDTRLLLFLQYLGSFAVCLQTLWTLQLCKVRRGLLFLLVIRVNAHINVHLVEFTFDVAFRVNLHDKGWVRLNGLMVFFVFFFNRVSVGTA